MSNGGQYRGQILEVIAYLNELISEDWADREEEFLKATSVDHLADIARMSKRLFQQEFQAYTHESVGAYKNRLRMEYAQTLLKDNEMSVSEISSHVGFANTPAFNNKFKKAYHQSPIERRLFLVRHTPKAEVILETEGTTTPKDTSTIPYRIERLPAKRILYCSVVGNYAHTTSTAFEEATWDRLEEFAAKEGLLSPATEYWGIAFDDSEITRSEQCRYDVAITINDKAELHLPIRSEIKTRTLSAGKYAVFTHRGDYSGLEAFYEQILPALPFELGDTPILEKYLNSPFDVTPSALRTEIWIPLE